MSKNVIELRKKTDSGKDGALRRFAVTSKEPVVEESWDSSTDGLSSQADQTWDLRVWQRIEGRGYVSHVKGRSQWANRGDHGAYVGTGDSAASALQESIGYRSAWPADLIAACEHYDSKDAEVE